MQYTMQLFCLVAANQAVKPQLWSTSHRFPQQVTVFIKKAVLEICLNPNTYTCSWWFTRECLPKLGLAESTMSKEKCLQWMAQSPPLPPSPSSLPPPPPKTKGSYLSFVVGIWFLTSILAAINNAVVPTNWSLCLAMSCLTDKYRSTKSSAK